MAYRRTTIGRRNGKTLLAAFYNRYNAMPNPILKAMLVAVYHKMLR